jgi:tripartite-type tricarboxylate transporter receptor subunit TctC
LVKAVTSSEAMATLSTAGDEATPSTGAQASAQLRTEFEDWGRLIKQIGFRQET